MNFSFENGLVFEKNFAIDPGRANGFENVIITHAHADHVCLNSKSNFFFSRQTHSLIESRYEKVANAKAKEFKQKFSMPFGEISLHNSGHILGSSQVLVEGKEKTVAITSDFKLQDSLVQKKAEILPCDSLVIESTFGLPCYKFPERKAVYEEIAKWILDKTKKSFVVLAGYSLGKAQELTAVCTQLAGISPVVHESIFKNNKVYESFGVKLGDYLKLDHNLKDSNVLIMPPSLAKPELLNILEETLHKKIFSAFATGWQNRGNYSKIFPLSDHADFEQLLVYVKEAKPKQVFTMHGHSREFAGYVQRRLGIPARPLEESPQKSLQEFF
ncbi:MAG: MBL fold metallo-hydrolase [Candidatus ainarchaeum sp.]|nr:MBL fold metallo-hydrolase [Candidatus ainarchaeum sp.]